jgi:predicted enzyme related to lactoylglutathione lyase
MAKSKGRVLGVGGVFFRSPDPAKLAAWYQQALGIAVESWGDTQGTSFSPAEMPPNAFTVWSVFSENTEYFGPSGQGFMINLVVDDLDAALKRVALAGGEVLPNREDADFGHFGWFVDPDGNRVELWEPPAQMPDEEPASEDE